MEWRTSLITATACCQNCWFKYIPSLVLASQFLNLFDRQSKLNPELLLKKIIRTSFLKWKSQLQPAKNKPLATATHKASDLSVWDAATREFFEDSLWMVVAASYGFMKIPGGY